ncbi:MULTISPECIES: hypothetical protein [Dermacoccus]|uniref:DUF6932 family protein n=1 Tax=Dermacoccus TaxID=57495 RepID=UPI001CA652C9|nr:MULTISPECIES: hypothetical protein [Dermacoccus]MBZ4496956.1 hypothetical protein [Dermacoccus sp. Tok2021]MCT1986902.1 hypothetical protein [Dermacoccus abyssi]
MSGDGFLPVAPGPHFATLDEVRDRFVTHAPNVVQRERVFRGLEIWIEQARDLYGSGRVWIDGGFVTHKADAPDDVDVAFLPDDRERATTAMASAHGLGLLTMQNLMCDIGSVARLQPVGGLVDAFLVDADDDMDVENMTWLFSQVKGVKHVRKGFVEVVI